MTFNAGLIPNSEWPPRNPSPNACADTMDREQWTNLKDITRELYIDKNLNCKQVAAILREQHDDRVRYESIGDRGRQLIVRRERTLQRHLKAWGFVKGSHFELLPNAVQWQSQEVIDLIAQKFWESKTDSQIWKELQNQGHKDVSYHPPQ